MTLEGFEGSLSPLQGAAVHHPDQSPDVVLNRLVVDIDFLQAVGDRRLKGFEVIDQKFFPMTGSSLERARRNQLSISCVITAKRAG